MKTIKTLIIATALAATLGPVSVYAMDQGQKPEKAAAAAQAFTPQQVKQANKNLWTAIDTDNLDRVNQALMCGANVSQPDLYGQTPLTRSCCEGRTGMVNFLLNHGAHIDQQNVVCNTPLLEACHKGHIGIVHLLLNRGANVDQVNQYGQTPLIGACREGHTGIVHLLLNHEANVDQVNRYGYTPLSMACNFGRHTAIVKMLVFHGATPSGQESDAMKAVIEQAREARRKVGDHCLVEQEIVKMCAKKGLPDELGVAIYDCINPFALIKGDKLFCTLTKEQIVKNRAERRAQESAVAQASKEREKDARAQAHEGHDYVRPPLPQSQPEQLLPSHAGNGYHLAFYVNHVNTNPRLKSEHKDALIALLAQAAGDTYHLDRQTAEAITASFLQECGIGLHQVQEENDDKEERKDGEMQE